MCIQCRGAQAGYSVGRIYPACYTSGAIDIDCSSRCRCSGLAGEGVEEEALSAKHGAFVVRDFGHDKGLFGILQELHVSAPPLHETEVHGSGGTKRQ
jgi:hypothetical protein